MFGVIVVGILGKAIGPATPFLLAEVVLNVAFFVKNFRRFSK